MESVSFTTPFIAYHSVGHGMNHYYLQRPDCVVHINHSGLVINRLGVDHLRTLDRPYKEVPIEEFYQAANEVLTALGFSYVPSIN